MLDSLFGNPLQDLEDVFTSSLVPKDEPKETPTYFVKGEDLLYEETINECIDELFEEDYGAEPRKVRETI